MNTARLIYRSRQFLQTLISTASVADLELAASVLAPPQLALFRRMPASEQAHALRVLSELIAQGETDPDLFTAALLHDVGKICSPLQAWERALIVLTGAICPRCLQRWGAQERLSPGESIDRLGWRRPFVVAVQHPVWGAQLAASCNASRRAVALILRHQEKLASGGIQGVTPEDRRFETDLLRKLQHVDDNN